MVFIPAFSMPERALGTHEGFSKCWRKGGRQEGREAGERAGLCRGLGLKGVHQDKKGNKAHKILNHKYSPSV